MSTALTKPSKKTERMYRVLLGLVELFLEVGTPIGSNTLKDNGFQDLSSATIRNYFVALEQEGFLHQQHTSGGRVPTDRAFRFYCDHYKKIPLDDTHATEEFAYLRHINHREIAKEMRQAAEHLSRFTGLAVFLSAPRFDQDFIRKIQLLHIDSQRYLCVLSSDFGLIQTELLYSKYPLNAISLKKIEDYLQWRLSGKGEAEELSPEEEATAKEFYQESLLRYLIHYSHFSQGDLFKTGFSKLLPLAEFQDPKALANGLALFEDNDSLRKLLDQALEKGELVSFIGQELSTYNPLSSHCSALITPYKINQSFSGSIGVLGPARLPYRKLMDTLEAFASSLSQYLTQSVYTFKIQYRTPKAQPLYLEGSQLLLPQKQEKSP